MDDLDPPTFRFGRRRDKGEESEGSQRPDGPINLDMEPDASQAEEAEPPQIRVERVEGGTGEQPAVEKPPLWRRLPFAKSETAARVLVAVP